MSAQKKAAETERLFAVAIIRDGKTWDGGRGSHAKLRRSLGDERRLPDDTEGFITTTGRFVDRVEAKGIARAAGQTTSSAVELLSSEIDWDGKPYRQQFPADARPKRKKLLFRP